MAESRTCYMSNIELVSTEDCCGWRDMRFIYHCSCILQFTQHLRISSVLHELASQVQSIRVHPSAAVPHTGALSVCGVRALERADVRLRPSLIWALPPPLSAYFKSSQSKAVICNIWIDLSLKLFIPLEDFLLLVKYFAPWSTFKHLSLNICKMCVCFCTMTMTWHCKTWKSSLSQKYICLKLNVILRFCFAWICTDGNK